MKIRIEIEPDIGEEEIVIRCSQLDENIAYIQSVISQASVKTQRLQLFKGDREYYLPLEDILFFETENDGVNAHTATDIYKVKYKLYELEQNLPRSFARVSKSAILNTKRIYSIDRNITASSVVQFFGTHKQVYVSRYYYKPLKNMLEEERVL